MPYSMSEPQMVHHWCEEFGFFRGLLFEGWKMREAVEEFRSIKAHYPVVRLETAKGPLLGPFDENVAEFSDLVKGRIDKAWRRLDG